MGASSGVFHRLSITLSVKNELPTPQNLLRTYSCVRICPHDSQSALFYKANHRFIDPKEKNLDRIDSSLLGSAIPVRVTDEDGISLGVLGQMFHCSQPGDSEIRLHVGNCKELLYRIPKQIPEQLKADDGITCHFLILIQPTDRKINDSKWLMSCCRSASQTLLLPWHAFPDDK